jgi:nitrite reductase/ring-hydroxylating ferredoxin subunit
MRYVKVAQTGDIRSDEALQVEAGGHRIALLRCDGDVHAVSHICTHELAFLSEGFVEGCYLECPLHGSQFDVRTGEVKSLPATKDLRTFPVKIEGDAVLVGIEEEEG